MKRMYSKKQLIEIVSQAIESGIIQVGSKMYRHLIICGDNDDDRLEFEIINNSPDVLDTEQKIIDALTMSKQSSAHYGRIVGGMFNTVHCQFSIKYDGTGLMTKTSSSWGNLGESLIDIVDTVTEL